MNCQKCGEVCSCFIEPPAGTVPESPMPAATGGETTSSQDLSGAEGTAWRDELASRLNRYRARRKAPPPRYPSLRLPFERVEASARAYSPAEKSHSNFEPISTHALALDGLQQMPSPPESAYLQPLASEQHLPEFITPFATPTTAKIIEFPRFAWAPPVPPPDQLAEPVLDRPRILEVPEVAPPPPALGGITIEPVQVEELSKRPGIDMPLHCAPLGLRIVAALTDWLIIAAAAAVFGLIFWKVAGVQPPRLQLLGTSVGILFVFWMAYQYLLLVYSARTPGLLLAHLELSHFDGRPTRRSLRRWRVMASFLSAVSLGMGYVWVFLDEDSLCWHDRITRTYLAPCKLDSKGKPQP